MAAPTLPPELAARSRAFARRLLDWYAREARSLPWRRTRDPYAVLVSEIMLQQTQASRVAGPWAAFLERFPTVPALAAAPRADVLRAWRGLGYNRRAVSLHRAAQALARDHGGRVPADLDALLALPGVGVYTARAVLAFAFGRDAAPVDTNVGRVLARALAGRPLGPAALQRLADEALEPGRARDWSGALMDLGATVCLARAPRCRACPVAEVCAWRGDAERPDPAVPSRARPQGRFDGSDRFHRGRLVDALRDGPLGRDALASAAALDEPARLEAIVSAIVADGLAEWDGARLRLPARERERGRKRRRRRQV